MWCGVELSKFGLFVMFPVVFVYYTGHPNFVNEARSRLVPLASNPQLEVPTRADRGRCTDTMTWAWLRKTAPHR